MKCCKKCHTTIEETRRVCDACKKELKKLLNKNWYSENRDHRLLKNREYCKLNRKKLESTRDKTKRNQWLKKKRENDPLYRLKVICRARTLQFLKRKGLTKSVKFNDYIGCTVEELKQHIESLFSSDMTWDNQGLWHLDHIVPLSSAKTEEEIYRLLHYSNLQPLWAKDNLVKGSKHFRISP